MESIIKRVLNDEWNSIQDDIERMAAEKVKARIDNKKIEVLAKLNGTDFEKMKEIVTVNRGE